MKITARDAACLLAVTLVPGLGLFCCEHRVAGVLVWLWLALVVISCPAWAIFASVIGLQALCLLFSIALQNRGQL